MVNEMLQFFFYQSVRQHLSKCAMLKKHIHTLLINTQDNEC